MTSDECAKVCLVTSSHSATLRLIVIERLSSSVLCSGKPYQVYAKLLSMNRTLSAEVQHQAVPGGKLTDGGSSGEKRQRTIERWRCEDSPCKDSTTHQHRQMSPDFSQPRSRASKELHQTLVGVGDDEHIMCDCRQRSDSHLPIWSQPNRDIYYHSRSLMTAPRVAKLSEYTGDAPPRPSSEADT